MEATRILRLRGNAWQCTVTVDWVVVLLIAGILLGATALALDLRPELLEALVRWWRS